MVDLGDNYSVTAVAITSPPDGTSEWKTIYLPAWSCSGIYSCVILQLVFLRIVIIY